MGLFIIGVICGVGACCVVEFLIKRDLERPAVSIWKRYGIKDPLDTQQGLDNISTS